jgi:predicted phosphodiesterase
MLKNISKLKAIVSKQYIFKYLLSILLVICITFAFTYTHLENLAQNNTNSEISQTTNEEETSDTNTPTDSDTPLEDSIAIETPVTEVSTSKTETKTTPQGTTSNPGPAPDETPIPEPENIPVVPESPSAIVAFYGDNQSDTDDEDINHQRVVTYILNSGANPVFNVGDIMEDGTQASLNRFNTVTSTLRASRAFYSALGNNDRMVGDSTTPSQLFLDNFTFPNNERWYSINYGNLHMVVLDSAFASGNQTQLNWLASDLQSANSQNRITGVMYHHPTFGSTISSYLVNYGVDFVISGHLHSYNHSISNGIHYYVLSGQPNIGYLKVKIYENRGEITSYNSGNGVIETIEFNER